MQNLAKLANTSGSASILKRNGEVDKVELFNTLPTQRQASCPRSGVCSRTCGRLTISASAPKLERGWVVQWTPVIAWSRRIPLMTLLQLYPLGEAVPSPVEAVPVEGYHPPPTTQQRTAGPLKRSLEDTGEGDRRKAAAK